MRIYKKYRSTNKFTLFNGDCKILLRSLPDESVDLVITSPPYCIEKAYEDPHNDLETFKRQHVEIFEDLYRVLKKECFRHYSRESKSIGGKNCVKYS